MQKNFWFLPSSGTGDVGTERNPFAGRWPESWSLIAEPEGSDLEQKYSDLQWPTMIWSTSV